MILNPEFYENIEQKNERIKEFNHAVDIQDYDNAVKIYEKIEALHRDVDPGLRLMAAHSYYKLEDTLQARLNYDIVKDVKDNRQSSIAFNQLGVISLMAKDSSKALTYFKEAVIKDTRLTEAKFNYELISKLYHPSAMASPLSEVADVDVVVSEDREDDFEEYQSENISKERALQLLDNLRISEKRGLISGSKKKERKTEKDW